MKNINKKKTKYILYIILKASNKFYPPIFILLFKFVTIKIIIIIIVKYLFGLETKEKNYN